MMGIFVAGVNVPEILNWPVGCKKYFTNPPLPFETQTLSADAELAAANKVPPFVKDVVPKTS